MYDCPWPEEGHERIPPVKNLQLRIAPDIQPELGSLMITEVVSSQPVPWFTQVIISLEGNTTVITRHFRDGKHRLCKLCPAGRCVFVEMVGSCQIAAMGKLSVDEAQLFDSNGGVWRVAR